MPRLNVVEERVVERRKLWRTEDRRWQVAGWLGESIEVIQHLPALERESPALGLANRRVVQLGGEPIPLRRR